MNGKTYIIGFLALAAVVVGATATALYAMQLKEERDIEEVTQSSRRYALAQQARADRADARLAELTFWGFKQRVAKHNREIDQRRARRRAARNA